MTLTLRPLVDGAADAAAQQDIMVPEVWQVITLCTDSWVIRLSSAKRLI